jgi:ATP-dependent Clp protease, protease subunit
MNLCCMKGKISNNIFINSAPEGDSLEVYVMEEIGDNWWTGGGVTKQSILNEIKGKKIKDIVLNISSPGGNVDDALAIKDMLIATGAPITAKVSGLTASAATIIMMCAGTIEMSDDSMILIHCASTWGGGNKGDLRKTADTLEMIDNVIAGLYAKKSGKDVAVCVAEMEKDQWMTAAQAKDFGIVDNVTASTPISNSMKLVIKNAVATKLITLPDGYKIDEENQIQNNDMTEKAATSMFNKFLNLLENAGIKLASDKKDVDANKVVKDITKDFKAAAEKILAEENPQPIVNAADYSATVTEAVNSIELDDDTALSLPNTPYEVSQEGATALATDLAAAITAESVSVTFDEAEASLSISVTASEQVLKTVNGTTDFTTGSSKEEEGEQTSNLEKLQKEVANLKKQKENKLKNSDADKIKALEKQRDELKAELKNLAGGKSGGSQKGEGFDNKGGKDDKEVTNPIVAKMKDHFKKR